MLRETLGTIIFQDQVLEVAIAFAGFSVGEAEGLRRAMSRKRSEAAIEAYHRALRRRRAAACTASTRRRAERVFEMVQGFSGFGFPKAHGAAFGLLAYQSTWLRVHYGPEFLCSLLNEQPMGFYPPDALVHEAQRRGIEVLAPDVNESEAECDRSTIRRARCGSASATCAGVREQEVKELVAAREEGGPFREPLRPGLARRRAARPSLELLAWSGACDSLVGSVRHRRGASALLWQLGVATPGRDVPGGTQLALPLDLPAPPQLRELSQWETMLADYASTGLTTRIASARAAARAAARRRRHQPRPRARCRTAARVQGRRPGRRPPAPRDRRTGSCSSCSRTSTGRST